MIGSIVKVTIDRPLGSRHPNHDDIIYPINYGYIEGIIAPDGEEQDAYVLGVDTAVKEFTGKIIAIIHRYNDVEEKWVVAPVGTDFSDEEIAKQVHFQEQYFDYVIKR
ncbi:MAG: inorganic pyrophosphatase [Clostridiales bacterium]|nr:inorganic pyrophosphatase [Clostridiales bacterium]